MTFQYRRRNPSERSIPLPYRLFVGGLFALCLQTPASASGAHIERPQLPAFSLAGDDGSASMWRNPANLAFDPDPGFALFYDQDLQATPAAIAASSNTGPLSTGFAHSGGSGEPGWWTFSLGLGVKLYRDLSIGSHVGWQVPEEGENFTTWDMGMTYRPLHWLGVSAITQNVGTAEPDAGIEERYGAGIALRPWGDLVRLGFDYLATGPTGSDPKGTLEAMVVARPQRGTVVRLYANDEGEVGAGLELYFDGIGGGAHGRMSLEDGQTTSAMAYALSGEPDMNLLNAGKKVPEITFDQAFPYQPPSGFFVLPTESYLHLLNRIQETIEDPTVKGLVLHLDWVPFSFAQIEEIQGLLEEARKRGKPILAYMDRATSNGAYLLASSADQIYLHPAAQLDLIGLSAELTFLRGTMDLVGVKPQFARRSEYKAAVEGYTHTGSSPASQEQMNALLDDLAGLLSDSISRGRGLPKESIEELINAGPYTGKEAVDAGLVDALIYPDQLEEIYDETFVKGYRLDPDYRIEDGVSGWQAPREIAVVYVDGVIVSGPSTGGGFFGGGPFAGSDTIVQQLDQARQDPAIKGVILRVDSPGGSAFASDEIWRAAQRVSEEGKPVVVSMGGMAASGGYYVSAGADAILAQSTTITGSIGVYGGKMSVGELYEKVGLSYELYNRGRNAAMFSMSKEFDPEEFAALDRLIGDTYAQFKARVEEGRGYNAAEVENVARGRVWSGQAALENGLVDTHGGFHDAIDEVRQLAGISERAQVRVVAYGNRPDAEGHLTRTTIRNLINGAMSQAMPELPEALGVIDEWQRLSDESVWAVTPYRLEIE